MNEKVKKKNDFLLLNFKVCKHWEGSLDDNQRCSLIYVKKCVAILWQQPNYIEVLNEQ